MRQSLLFGRTLREAPADAQTPGHRLLLRAAIARPLAAGLYTWLPLGFRVAKRVEQIIREEMNRIGCQELEMPVLTPAEPWKDTGRWEALEPITFRTTDHNGREFMVSYTHEEFVHLHAKQEVLSYRQLPFMVYHFQAKGRDEARPRAGLLRAREFVMKDAYSFDADPAGLERSYKAQHGAYARIFARMGLDAISVESDTGATAAVRSSPWCCRGIARRASPSCESFSALPRCASPTTPTSRRSAASPATSGRWACGRLVCSSTARSNPAATSRAPTSATHTYA